MKHFITLVHKDEGSAFGVSFPDLPSVFSAADREEDLRINAIEALQLWAEDGVLPVPATLDQLMARGGIRAELASGAFLMHVPWVEA